MDEEWGRPPMMIEYRCIDGRWQTFTSRNHNWHGLDYRGESYWIVPGTFPDDLPMLSLGGIPIDFDDEYYRTFDPMFLLPSGESDD